MAMWNTELARFPGSQGSGEGQSLETIVGHSVLRGEKLGPTPSSPHQASPMHHGSLAGSLNPGSGTPSPHHHGHSHSGQSHSGHSHSGQSHSPHGHEHGHGHGHGPDHERSHSGDSGCEHHGHGHGHGHGHEHQHECKHEHNHQREHQHQHHHAQEHQHQHHHCRHDPEEPHYHHASPQRTMGVRAQRALRVAVCLSSVFMVAEIIGGWLANSIAIMSDAAHLSGDVASFVLALSALKYSKRPPSPSYTYGGSRAGALGAFVSLLTVWFLTAWIVIEALARFAEFVRCARLEKADDDSSCKPVDSRLMFAIGLGGLAVNITLAVVLWAGNAGAHVQHMHSHGEGGSCSGHGHGHAQDHGHSHGSRRCSHAHYDPAEDKAATDIRHLLSEGQVEAAPARKQGVFTAKAGEDINVKGAMVHAVGDCIQSLGVVLAAATIWIGNMHTVGEPNSARSWFNLADPCISFVFAIVTVWTTKGLLKQLTRVLLEGAEDGRKTEELLKQMQNLPTVQSVHDFHYWNLSLDQAIVSVHVVPPCETKAKDALRDVTRLLANNGISHVTIQVDNPGEAHLCSPCAPMVRHKPETERVFI
eukprot:Hpha_TRINITY_DN15494_c2_g19::TRINITY_DN15494_c2_g19_i1::g.177255::m.177255/K14689/SLC30A2, ZNT2; solute carrier family 30 (zinc transporter), member 2